MHIPDGYLSPETCLVLYGATVPFWYRASRRIKQILSTRTVPLISIFSAFCFTIQMLNVPIPGGTSAHAVGGTLMAIVLGPWPAVIGMSVSLGIQALFFGDGGITTYGANAFNLGVILPLSGYAAYRLFCALLTRKGHLTSGRRALAAAIGSYIGINLAGVLVGLELGVQPIFWTANGHALYSPYGLATTLPAIMFAHLTIVGMAEALLTGFALAYLLRAHPELLRVPGTEAPGVTGRPRLAQGLLIALAALVLLSPLGLIASGSAFGEWGPAELHSLVGYVPAGLAGLSGAWQSAPLRDYQLPFAGAGQENALLATAAYALSALVGVGLIFLVLTVLARLLAAGQREQARTASSATANAGWLRRRPTSTAFLAKTIATITQVLERTIFSAEYTRYPGLLQGIDPRAKLVMVALLLLCTGLAQNLVVIVAVYVIVLVLARASLLPSALLIKGVWLGMPLFAAVVALPAIFLSPGPALVAVELTNDLHLAVSASGLISAMLLVARVGASVSLVLLLVLTTRWTDVLKALTILRVPAAFVVVLGMTYRYLFLLLHTVNDLFLARSSRTVGVSSRRETQRWLAGTTGALVSRSFHMSDNVYQAMISRGFAGEIRTITDFRMLNRDWLIVLLSLVLVPLLIVIDRAQIWGW